MNKRNKILSALYILGQAVDVATTFIGKRRFDGMVIDMGPALGKREIKIKEANPLLRKLVENNRWFSFILVKAGVTLASFLAFNYKNKERLTRALIVANLIGWSAVVWNTFMMIRGFSLEKRP